MKIPNIKKITTGKGVAIFIVILFAVLFAVYYLLLPRLEQKSEAQSFSTCGVTITLNSDFRETSLENFNLAFHSDHVLVVGLKENFNDTTLPASKTVEEYAEAVCANNQLESSIIDHQDGTPHFEYSSSQDKQTYHYDAYMYKTGDSFWLIQFAVLEDDVDKYQSSIREWALSICFDNP